MAETKITTVDQLARLQHACFQQYLALEKLEPVPDFDYLTEFRQRGYRFVAGGILARLTAQPDEPVSVEGNP